MEPGCLARSCVSSSMLICNCKIWLSIAGALILTWGQNPEAELPMPCRQLPVVMTNGLVDITQTLVNCSDCMASSRIISSYFQTYPITVVEANVALDNLFDIAELAGTATFDFHFLLRWNDTRWSQSDELWDALDDGAVSEGIDITDIKESIGVWTPDEIVFASLSSSDLTGESLKLKQMGQLYWTRQFKVTLKQSQFNWQQYPLDVQQIELSFASYTTSNRTMNLTFSQVPVEYLLDNGEVAFSQNPIWNHVPYEYTTNSEIITRTASDSGSGITSFFPRLTLKITVSRKAEGVIYRIGIPLLFVCMLAACTFYATRAMRTSLALPSMFAQESYTFPIDLCIYLFINLHFSLFFPLQAALYIVASSSIPRVGYLTIFDYFCIRMFVVTILVIFTHIVVIGVLEKVKIWPLRPLLVRIIECLARVTMLPSVFLYFITLFGEALRDDSLILGITVCVIYIVFIGGKELGGIHKAFHEFKKALWLKIVDSKMPDDHISILEKYAFNMIVHHRFTSRIWREIDKINRKDEHTENMMNSLRNDRRKINEHGGYENEVMNQEAIGTEVEMNDAGFDGRNIDIQVDDGAHMSNDVHDFHM